MSTPSPDDEQPFIPQAEPLTLDQLAEYTEDGGVVIRRSDVERAIATSDKELRPYLEAPLRKPKK